MEMEQPQNIKDLKREIVVQISELSISRRSKFSPCSSSFEKNVSFHPVEKSRILILLPGELHLFRKKYIQILQPPSILFDKSLLYWGFSVVRYWHASPIDCAFASI